MKATQFISKGIATTLLVVMMYSYLCSSFCAIGIYSCCNEKEELAEHHENSCSNKKEHDEKHEDGCQKEHLVFFNTIGQYHSLKEIGLKVFHPFVLILISKNIIQPVISTDIAFAYNGFHPPPPKENIRTLIQSFLI